MAAEKAEEEEAADALEDVVEEVHEWSLPLNMEEGNPDELNLDPAAVGEKPKAKEYEVVEYTMKNTVAELKAVAVSLRLSSSGNKGPIFQRIRECKNESISKLEDPVGFSYRSEKLPEGSVPKWIILNPVAAEAITGMNMATGGQEGHFAPTNKENAIGATKYNYLHHESEKIQRPVFARKPEKKKKKSNGPETGIDTDESDPPPPPISEKGGPSKAAHEVIKDLQYARPKDFFDTQITPEFVSKVMVNCTNARAASEGAGAGGTTYQNWKPFDTNEMYKMIGLLFANGLSPKPTIEQWFLTTYDNRLFGNNYVSTAMDKVLPRGERVSGHQRWKHFRRFFCCYDF